MRWIFLPILFCGYSFAGDPEFHGQLSLWGAVGRDSAEDARFGVRYLPSLTAERSGFGSGVLDIAATLNISGTAAYFHEPAADWETSGNHDLYRLWVRYATEQSEVRLGLQKINFGSATLLRPLMWFDRVDPRDPLALTDGVYGLLARRYFLNNANVWGWVLYGNDEPKGWERYPTDENRPEFGGRFQFPFGQGEFGLTFHNRRVDEGTATTESDGFGEHRYGFDGKWDLGVGLWVEAAVIEQDVPESAGHYQRLVNVGCDYTFGLGNGVTALGELFSYETAEDVFGSGEGTLFTAVSASYPLGVLDMLTAMVYFEWESDDWYRFFNWQRTYDRWSFNVMVYWNPDAFELYEGISDVNRFSGRGFQLLVAFDH